MRADQRLWRTADGGLVHDDDPAAAILAYAAGDEIAAADEALLGGEKAKAKPADKQAAKPANKGRTAKPKTDDEG